MIMITKTHRGYDSNVHTCFINLNITINRLFNLYKSDIISSFVIYTFYRSKK